MDKRGDGSVKQINKAELFGINVAQENCRQADARAQEARAHFREMVAAAGLDPDADYSIAADGTVTVLGPVADPVTLDRAARRRQAKGAPDGE